jgi:hypothetical protein
MEKAIDEEFHVMGFFAKFRGKRIQNTPEVASKKTSRKNRDTTMDFFDWLNHNLSKELPNNIVAFNFNLYESPENSYLVELVGCNSFDEGDSDWACDEVFDTRDKQFAIPMKDNGTNWEQGLIHATELIDKYLQEGKYAEKLTSCLAVGVGFVNGDITIVHRLESSKPQEAEP